MKHDSNNTKQLFVLEKWIANAAGHVLIPKKQNIKYTTTISKLDWIRNITFEAKSIVLNWWTGLLGLLRIENVLYETDPFGFRLEGKRQFNSPFDRRVVRGLGMF